MSPPRRPVVVVFGMHRSGTSLLASLLAGAGIHFGTRLLAADEHNQAGYWEQADVFAVDDEILRVLDRVWTGPSGPLPLPRGWTDHAAVAPLRARLVEIVRTETAAAGGLTWGLKDPRISRLTTLWDAIFLELGLRPIYLLAARAPAAVVGSVVARDGIPADRAELLWLLHNLDAVEGGGTSLAAVVDYDGWVRDPTGQADALAVALRDVPGFDAGALHRAAGERFQPGLRHHVADGGAGLPYVSEAWTLLQRAARDGLTQGVSAALADLRHVVIDALALVAPLTGGVVADTGAPARETYALTRALDGAVFEGLGATAHLAAWDVEMQGARAEALLLHPPARVAFEIPWSGPARLRFAVGMHPAVWDRPEGCACRFTVSVDDALAFSLTIDPGRHPDDRRWHECALDIPSNEAGPRTVRLETTTPDGVCAHRWALWRAPVLERTAPGTRDGAV